MDEVIDFLYYFRNYYIYVSFIIGFPSFLLYLSEVVVIIKHKQLHNSFNILFAVRAIANFFKMWASMFAYRLPKICGGFLLPFYQLLPTTVLSFYSFFLYFCFYADNLSTAAIQLNRFIAIAFPIHYDKIWRYLLPLSVLIIYGVPFALSFCLITPDVQLSIISPDPLSANRTTFSFRGYGNNCIWDSTSIVSTFSVSFLIACTIMSLMSIFLYHWRKRNGTLNIHSTGQANNNNSTTDRIERNLLIYAMCTFVGLGFITLFFNFRTIEKAFNLELGEHFPDLKSALSTIIHDSCNIILPSWLMLWASSTFRQKWAVEVLPKRWNLWKKETKSKTINLTCRPLPTQNNGNRQMIPLSLTKISIA